MNINGHRIATLSQLTTLISSGSTPLGGQAVYLDDGPVMLVRSQNVHMNRLDVSDVAYISNELDSQMQRSVVRYNDVLLNITGASIGRVARFNLSDRRANVNQHVCIIRPKPDELHSRYLEYFLSSPQVQNDIHNRHQHGGTRQALTFAQISEFEIPVPPLPEQKRIADILDKADSIRRKRQEVSPELMDLEKSLFEESFAPSVAGHDQWPFAALDEVLFFQEGPGVRKWQFTDAGVKLLNVGNIVNGSLQLGNTERYLSEEEAFGKYQHFLAQAGDLVMATSGVTWGKTAWVEDVHLPLCMNTSTVRFRPLDEIRITKSYMHAFLKSRFFTRQVDKLVTGSAQPNFGPSHLKQVQIVIPDIESQVVYEQKLKQFGEISQKHRCATEDVEDLFRSLVQHAFKGEL